MDILPRNLEIKTAIKTKQKCSKCGGKGFIINSDDTVDICDCVSSSRTLILRSMNIPKRFWHVVDSLDMFCRDRQKDESYENAYVAIIDYVMSFHENNGEGILFVGKPGVGKTYLAIFTLLYIEQKHRIRGLFYDTKSLILDLKTLIAKDKQENTQDYNIFLKKIINTPILVLDDLGSETLTDYNKDIITHIIYSRYNQLRPIIITTNLELDKQLITKDNKVNKAIIGQKEDAAVYDFSSVSNTIGADLTLRLGENITSRLSEMCRVIYLFGEDRRKVKSKREINS